MAIKSIKIRYIEEDEIIEPAVLEIEEPIIYSGNFILKYLKYTFSKYS